MGPGGRVVVHRVVVHTLPPRFLACAMCPSGLLPAEPCVDASSIDVYGNLASAHTRMGERTDTDTRDAHGRA
jgi:hypothetical protein